MIATAILAASLALSPPDGTAWAHSDGEPKSAAAEDMAVFEPYIGRFRSEDKIGQDGETEYHFVIDYSWYDRNRTIVRYALELHIPAREEVRGIGDGFYYFDRREGRIGVFGVFPDGRMGTGSMGEFDPETHARAVWVDALSPDGQPVEVHDAFELVDGNRWRNVTHIRPDGGEWQEIGRDLYTRIGETGTAT